MREGREGQSGSCVKSPKSPEKSLLILAIQASGCDS